MSSVPWFNSTAWGNRLLARLCHTAHEEGNQGEGQAEGERDPGSRGPWARHSRMLPAGKEGLHHTSFLLLMCCPHRYCCLSPEGTGEAQGQQGSAAWSPQTQCCELRGHEIRAVSSSATSDRSPKPPQSTARQFYPRASSAKRKLEPYSALKISFA